MNEIVTRPSLPFKLACLNEPSRYKVIYGGRGSGKSWTVARGLLRRGFRSPLRILCAREFQNSLAESVHRLLADQVEILGLPGFYTIRKTSITGANGTSFVSAQNENVLTRRSRNQTSEAMMPEWALIY